MLNPICFRSYKNIGSLVLAILLCSGIATTSAQTSNRSVAIPAVLLLLAEDACIEATEVGSLSEAQLDSTCSSEGQAGSFARYYELNHGGGPIHIELASNFPNSFDPILFLREGRERISPVINSDDNGHEDYRGSRIVYPNLAKGVYILEATSVDPNLETSFKLFTYGQKVTASVTNRLNDTAVDSAGSSDTTNSALCNAAGGLSNQDCSQGRSADPHLGFASSENDDDGENGFSFLKVSSTGAPLTAAAGSWACVKDNVTGLMWEVKTNDDSVHDADFTYSWFDSNMNTNGGATGTEDGGNCPMDVSCDTQGFISKVNTDGLCGYNDWRLPDLSELLGLLNFNKTTDTIKIDTAFFPNTKKNTYWTGSPMGTDASSARFVSFDTGASTGVSRDLGFFVRAVRDGG